MTQGAVIFAFNNEQIDYVSMARWNAHNIRRHLNIPVCLITDTQHQDLSGFDKVICVGPPSLGTPNKRYFSDYDTNVTWHNLNRMDAYSLSPWDQTLVLDADYVVASDQLSLLFDSNHDFLAHRTGYDIAGQCDFVGLNNFGKHNMPMSWATVMYFSKNSTAKSVFDIMVMVKNNWKHYRNIYNITQGTYRNDFALSIALGIVDGHTLQHPSIPWGLASLMPQYGLQQLDKDSYRVEFDTANNQTRWVQLDNQDFHAMGKKQLEKIIANPC